MSKNSEKREFDYFCNATAPKSGSKYTTIGLLSNLYFFLIFSDSNLQKRLVKLEEDLAQGQLLPELPSVAVLEDSQCQAALAVQAVQEAVGLEEAH